MYTDHTNFALVVITHMADAQKLEVHRDKDRDPNFLSLNPRVEV